MMKRALLVLLTIIILLSGYWSYLGRDKGKPVESFEAFFKAYKEQYALFGVKQVDWDKEYAHYVPKVNEDTSDDELFQVFQELLTKLDDKHCYIYRFNEIYFPGFGLPSLNYYDLLSFDFRVPTTDFSLSLVENNYLVESEKSVKVYSTLPPVGVRNIFTTGWLKDSVAYIHMTEMSNRSQEVHEAINDFVKKYGKAKGFVVDVRDNIGGYSHPVKALAEYFTDQQRTYAISRLRKPESTYAFQEAEKWMISPDQESDYQQQAIALLVNQNTQSAAELFTLMMSTIPTVRVVGNTTSGIFADTHIGKLPNGWEYRLSARLTNDWNDKVVEDIGVVPDTIITNTADDLKQGRDRIMDYALEYVFKAMDQARERDFMTMK